MNTDDDRELMQAAKHGNSRAFGELIRRHQKRVYRVVVHMLRDAPEAEDVVQDTFLRAHAALDRFDGRSQPYTWFYRIAVNLALNRLRSRKRARDVVPAEDPRLDAVLVETHPSSAPETNAERAQLARDLCDAVDQLSETLRTTLILVAVDGLPHGDVSTILGCPEGTVAWRIHEARKRIRAFLVERGHEQQETGR
ncbi:MAG: hypothetical protein RJA70_1934 [Pseudomonadota bacterium]|jgi:RNA polymerase sigma-70 factor (ECF subfamily)